MDTTLSKLEPSIYYWKYGISAHVSSKLLIPSVIDAEPDKYLFNRALALWTSINFQYFAKLKEIQMNLKIESK